MLTWQNYTSTIAEYTIIWLVENINTKLIFFSRTLTWVYDAILDDLVFPAEIVGKRIRVKLDGKQMMKVHLDKTQQTNIEHKVISLNYIFFPSPNFGKF